MKYPTTGAQWRANVLTVLVGVNDRQRALLRAWRLPRAYRGAPETDVSALLDCAQSCEQSARELQTVAQACRARAATMTEPKG